MQVQELQEALTAISGSPGSVETARQLALEVVDQLLGRQAERAGIPVDSLFPTYTTLRASLVR